MSLHRVSSMSSYEHIRGSSPARSEHKKISFNPAGSWSPAAKEEPVDAFEVSRGKRILQIAIAIIYCLFSAGVVFGYAALKPVLIEEGVYREFCVEERLSILERTCYEQEIRYFQSMVKVCRSLLTAYVTQAERYVHYCSSSYKCLCSSCWHHLGQVRSEDQWPNRSLPDGHWYSAHGLRCSIAI